MAAPTKRHADNIGSEFQCKLSSQEADSKRLGRFIKWSDENNFNLSDKVRVGREGSCAQFGMIAVEDIDSGEELFQIPRSKLLNSDTSGMAMLIEEDENIQKSTSGWVPLLLSLMFEYNNPASTWRPYLDLVPDFKELDLPMFWPREEVKNLLDGTGVPEAVDQDLNNISKEFSDIVLPFVKRHGDKLSPICLDLEFYKKMVAFVMAYSFTEPEKINDESDSEDEDEDEEERSPPPMMVPMADILNHIANNNAHLTFETDCLKMVSTKPIKKGEEVFNTYGHLANWHLLHMYGFAEKYPANHNDTADISTQTLLESAMGVGCNTDTLLSKKKKVFQDMGWLGTSTTCMCIVGTKGVLTEEETLQVLKILVLSEDDLEQFAGDEGWIDNEETEESLSFDDIKTLPQEYQTILSRSASASLKRYSTTLQEDEQRLTETNLTFRERFALYTNYGQKKILHQLIKACNICTSDS